MLGRGLHTARKALTLNTFHCIHTATVQSSTNNINLRIIPYRCFKARAAQG